MSIVSFVKGKLGGARVRPLPEVADGPVRVPAHEARFSTGRLLSSPHGFQEAPLEQVRAKI